MQITLLEQVRGWLVQVTHVRTLQPALTSTSTRLSVSVGMGSSVLAVEKVSLNLRFACVSSHFYAKKFVI